jgi:hypothetical protein
VTTRNYGARLCERLSSIQAPRGSTPSDNSERGDITLALITNAKGAPVVDRGLVRVARAMLVFLCDMPGGRAVQAASGISALRGVDAVYDIT